MVVIFFPAADATGSTQDRTALPSRCTVHARTGPSAAVLEPGYAAQVAQRPEQRHLVGSVDLRVWPFSSSFMGGLRWLRSRPRRLQKRRHGTIGKACLIL